jgi:hypothetical protein
MYLFVKYHTFPAAKSGNVDSGEANCLQFWGSQNLATEFKLGFARSCRGDGMGAIAASIALQASGERY